MVHSKMLILCELKITIMKRIILTSFMMLSLLATTVAQENNSQKKDPVGYWKFEAPYAPEGYTAGAISVTSADNVLSATMSFSSMEFKFPAVVKSVSDSLFLSVNLEGQFVQISLKLLDNENMTGKAVYTDGSVPLTLKRDKEPVQGSK
jgi:hypothetical protein